MYFLQVSQPSHSSGLVWKKYLEHYRNNIKDQSRIVGIDSDSLAALAESKTSVLYNLSLSIARSIGSRLFSSPKETLESSVRALEFLSITSIGELEERLEQNSNLIVKFAQRWLGEGNYEKLPEVVGILYLAYVLLAAKEDESKIQKFSDYVSLGGNQIETANRILQTYSEVDF